MWEIINAEDFIDLLNGNPIRRQKHVCSIPVNYPTDRPAILLELEDATLVAIFSEVNETFGEIETYEVPLFMKYVPSYISFEDIT